MHDSAADQKALAGCEFALLVQQARRPPQPMLAYLRLLLNYLYGLEVLTAAKHTVVASLALKHGAAVRAVFVIQDEPVLSRSSLVSTGHRGRQPVVLLLPEALVAEHQLLCRGLPNVRVASWEQALGTAATSLQTVVAEAFEASSVPRLPVDDDSVSYEQLQTRVQKRLRHLSTLPTLPEVVFQILQLLESRETSADDLEQVLLNDPSMVHKMLQVGRSAAFAGVRDGGEWTLKQAIVRLGFRQIGAIAQQVKLINALVKPLQSKFDLRRFWEHSVATAVVAHRLCADRLVELAEPITFDRYWIAALLHDIGKLVLGFFAWDYFEEVLVHVVKHEITFGRAEERLGHRATHEYLGRLVLLTAGAPEALAEAVAGHDTTGARPSPLTALIHVASNLTKDLGLGYLPQEHAIYSASALMALNTTKERMDELCAGLGDELAGQATELVRACA